MRCLLGALGVLLTVVAAPAASAQQDRVALPPILDSWYKVIQEEEHVGFVHERLERASATVSWRFNYTVDMQSDLTLPDPKDPERTITLTESVSLVARLDDTYSPTYMSLQQSVKDFDLRVTLNSSEGGGRRVVITLPTEDRLTYQIDADEEIYYSMPLMFISMRQNGLMARPGLRQAKVFAPKPEGKPVADLVFEVGEMTEREYLEKATAAVTPITFEQAPVTEWSELRLTNVYIDKYGRMLEAATRGGIRVVIAKGEEDAVGTGRLTRRGRDDPFRKDTRMRPEGDAEGDETPTEVVRKKRKEITPDKFTVELEAAEARLEDLRVAVERKQTKQIKDVYEDILMSWEGLRAIAVVEVPEQIMRVDRLKQEADTISGIPKALRNQAFALYEEGIKAFEREDCEEMENRLKEIREIQGRRELKSSEELEEVAKWILDLEPKVEKCKVRVELAQKSLDLSGTVIQLQNTPQPLDLAVDVFGHRLGERPRVRFVKAMHIAIINGKEYLVGDTVEGEGVKIEKIWKQGVTVSLKDEQRDVPLSPR